MDKVMPYNELSYVTRSSHHNCRELTLWYYSYLKEMTRPPYYDCFFALLGSRVPLRGQHMIGHPDKVAKGRRQVLIPMIRLDKVMNGRSRILYTEFRQTVRVPRRIVVPRRLVNANGIRPVAVLFQHGTRPMNLIFVV